MPMYRRLPKRGFTNPFRVENQAVNLSQLKKVSATEVSPETLYSAGPHRQARRSRQAAGHR